MVKTDNGQIEYDGDAITLTADICTLMLAIRDLICRQSDYPEVQKTLCEAYEQTIIQTLAMPMGQSDDDRMKSRRNP